MQRHVVLPLEVSARAELEARLRRRVRMARLLPYRAAERLGRMLGLLAFAVALPRRRVALDNLQHAFPDKTPTEIRSLARKAFQNYGISLVEISIPESVAAQLTTDSFLGNLELGEGVIQKEGTYWTQSALDGGEPRLSIRASQTVGTLRLNFAQPAPTPAELPVQETQVETASAVDPVEI